MNGEFVLTLNPDDEKAAINADLKLAGDGKAGSYHVLTLHLLTS